jgi:hypothetical protein
MKVYGIGFHEIALLRSIWRLRQMRRWGRGLRLERRGRFYNRSHEMLIDELLPTQALYQLFSLICIGLLLLLFNGRVGRTLSYCRYPCQPCTNCLHLYDTFKVLPWFLLLIQAKLLGHSYTAQRFMFTATGLPTTRGVVVALRCRFGRAEFVRHLEFVHGR